MLLSPFVCRSEFKAQMQEVSFVLSVLPPVVVRKVYFLIDRKHRLSLDYVFNATEPVTGQSELKDRFQFKVNICFNLARRSSACSFQRAKTLTLTRPARRTKQNMLKRSLCSYLIVYLDRPTFQLQNDYVVYKVEYSKNVALFFQIRAGETACVWLGG